MRFYRSLSGIGLFKKYTSKFMVIAFLGIHLPLFGVIGLLIATSGPTITKISFFLLTLGFTLLATVITLFVLNLLLVPLRTAQSALSDYLHHKTLPQLPNDLNDEVGILMRDINTVVATVHASMEEKDRVIKALSHDLRAPATNIRALLDLLNEEKDPAEISKYLKSIEDSVKYQLKLMDEMVVTYEDPK